MRTPSREELLQLIDKLNSKISANPQDIVAYHELGVAYMHLNDWDQAKKEFLKMLELAPKRSAVSAHYHLGTIYAEQGNMDQAISEWKEVLQADERNVFAHFSIAKAFAHKKFYDAALMHLRKADRYNTNRSLKLIKQTMARVYTLKGEYERAIETWKAVELIDPQDVHTLHEITVLNLYVNQLDEAIEYGEKELSLGAVNQSVYYNLGLAHLGKQDYLKSIECFEKALEQDQEDVSIRVNLGEAYARQGLIDKAIHTWEEVLKLDPSNVHASYNLGMILYDTGRHKAALREWSRTLSIDEHYLPAYVSRGSAFLALEDLDSALQEWLKAKALAPKNPVVRGNLAELYLFLNQFDNALAEAEQAIKYKAENPIAFVFAGIAYAKLGSNSRAAIAWEQAKEINENIFYLAVEIFSRVLGLEGIQRVKAAVKEEEQAICDEIITVLKESPEVVQNKVLQNNQQPKDSILSALINFLRH